jgi:hypothetical protein
MTDRELQVMRHALGLHISDVAYRNHYVAGADDIPLWDALVDRGLAERGHPTPGWRVYSVTDAGRAALSEQTNKRTS